MSRIANLSERGFPMRYGLFVISSIFVSSVLSASQSDIRMCKSCHSAIYAEYEESAHRKSTIYDDPLFAEMVKRSPEKRSCAKCHNPGQDSVESHDGIDCLSCHKITSIKRGEISNNNIYGKDKRTFYSAEESKKGKKIVYHEESSWFGLVKKKSGSPYHDIDYSNDIYYNGEQCMGCHSHKKNGHGLDLCRISGGVGDKSNCISCHMPKVPGSATSIRKSGTHAYHGFGGVSYHKAMGKYVALKVESLNDGFTVDIKNDAPHDLMLHPMRVVELRVNVISAGATESYRKSFSRVIGHDGKPAMPWLADEVVKNDMVAGGKSLKVKFDRKLKSGDRVEVELGYRALSGAVAGKLGLADKGLDGFKAISKTYYEVP